MGLSRRSIRWVAWGSPAAPSHMPSALRHMPDAVELRGTLNGGRQPALGFAEGRQLGVTDVQMEGRGCRFLFQSSPESLRDACSIARRYRGPLLLLAPMGAAVGRHARCQ